MIYIQDSDFNRIYLQILSTLRESGKLLGKSKSRSGLFFELENPCASLVYLKKNWLWCLLEGLSRFAFHDPHFINPGYAYKYRPNWAKKLKAEGGLKFDYAYGDIYDGQIFQILKRLKKGERESIISVWDHKYLDQKKYKRRPCTIAHHFFVDDIGLHLNTFMRTNDVMNLLPYDVFHHTLLQRYIATELKLPLGHYRHFASQIYYQKKRDTTGSVSNAIKNLTHRKSISVVKGGEFGQSQVELLCDLVKKLEQEQYNDAYFSIQSYQGSFFENYSIALLYLYLKKSKNKKLFNEIKNIPLDEFEVIKL